MATVIETPDCYLHAAYNPIVWKVQEFTVADRQPPAMFVQFYVNGDLFHEGFLSPVEAFTAPPQYIFEINAQEIVQSFFNNDDTLPPPGEGIFVSGYSASVYAVVTPWLDDGDGILVETLADQFTTSTIQAINAYRRGQDVHCLDEYAEGFWPNAPGERPWLTRLSSSIELCRDSNFWLGAYNGSNILLFAIRTYDSEGNELDSDVLGASGLQTQQVQIIGVGPQQIQDTNGVWLGDGITIGPDVAYYTIESGYISFTPGVSNNVNVPFTIHLTRVCCEYEIVFLNSFGIYESFPVQKEQVLNYRTEGDNFTSARLLPSEANYLLSRGQSYLSKEGVSIMQFSLPQSRNAYQSWYQDMFNSPDVYLNKDGQYIPVLLTVPVVNLKSNFGIIVTLEWSNTDLSQRN